MNIKAAIVQEKEGPITIEELTLDEPKENEVLIKVAACGICHTDEVGRLGFFPLSFPAVFGHEGAGTVIKTGAGVTDFKEGDKVGFSYSYCGTCEACKRGTPYGCSSNRRLNFTGTHFDGTKRLSFRGKEVSAFFGQSAFATHAVVHQNNLIHVDDDFPLYLAAPMGCGIQTGAGTVLNVLRPGPDTSILITGCGAVGLSAIMAAKLSPCSRIIACDVSDEKLALAKEFGATHTVNFMQYKGIDNLAKAVADTFDGHLADFAFQCTGSPVAHSNIYHFVRNGGGLCELGFFINNGDATINPHFDLCSKEINLVGSWVYTLRDYATTFDFLRRAKEIGIPVTDLITDAFPLDKINEAHEFALAQKGLKVAVTNVPLDGNTNNH